MKQEFFIIASGWNCATYVEQCVASVQKQQYAGKVTAVFISDGSTDNTADEIEKAIKDIPNFHSMISTENIGAAGRRHKAIMHFKPDPETAVLFLGLDDQLRTAALTRISKEYEAGKWMTYGNWINQQRKGLPKGFDLDFPDYIHQSRSYRQATYRSTAPNTFKAKLYYKIPAPDLTINGTWIQTCTEGEVMFSCLEMCGKDRIGIIKDHIYLYNQHRPTGSIKRFGSVKQEILKIITGRKKRPLYEDIP